MLKGSKNKIRVLSILTALILAVALSASACAEIIVQPDKNADESTVEGVKQVVQHFNAILSDELKISLTEKVTIYVCANQESFQRTLSYRMNVNHFTAKEYAKIYTGLSSG